MDNYFFEEKLIVQIYDFFKQNSNRTSNHLTIYEFLEGKDGFLWTGEDGIGSMDVGMVKYISKICKKMENDINESNSSLKIQYIAKQSFKY